MGSKFFNITRERHNKVITIAGLRIKLRVANFGEFIVKKFAFLIKILDAVLIKRPHNVVFYSSPDFSDNTKAFYDYLQKTQPKEFSRFIYLYKDEANVKYADSLLSLSNAKIRTEIFPLYSFKGVLALLTSKMIIINEAIRPMHKILSKRHMIINLWHGMPIKTIGYIEKNISKNILQDYKFLGEHSYLFATSDIFKALMSNSFMANPEKVFITGLPRNDYIIENDKKKIITEAFSLNDYDHVILYTPTYREMHSRKEDNKTFKNIFYTEDYDEKEFCSYLEENKVLLIFKPHIFDEYFYNQNSHLLEFGTKNIKYIDDKFLKNSGFTLYELFKYSNLLISDFSSISIDYVISGKPVLYLLSGANSYADERGFSLEDNYEIFMPGRKMKNYAELKSSIVEILEGTGLDVMKNIDLRLLHKYLDGNSSERIWRVLQNLIKNKR